jgi:peptidoglycan/LPS O-acetylase OafA/YrhL
MNGLFDIGAVCIVFPMIILGVAHSHNAEPPSGISAWSGNMSYPLYATHYPLVRAAGLMGRRFSDTLSAHLLVATFGTVAMVVFSSGVYAAYDVPLRRWLTYKFRGHDGRRLGTSRLKKN